MRTSTLFIGETYFILLLFSVCVCVCVGGGGGVVTLGTYFTVLLYKNCLKVVNIETMSANIAFFSSSPLLLPLHIFSFSCSNVIFNLVKDNNTLFWIYSSQITVV